MSALPLLMGKIAALEAELRDACSSFAELESESKQQLKLIHSRVVILEESNAYLERKLASCSAHTCCTCSHHVQAQKNNSDSANRYNRNPMSNPPSNIPQGRSTGFSAQQLSSTPFRIIWGTRRSCSAGEMQQFLSTFIPDKFRDFNIRRSYRRLGPKMAWWFTITAPSSLLSELDTAWHSGEG